MGVYLIFGNLNLLIIPIALLLLFAYIVFQMSREIKTCEKFAPILNILIFYFLFIFILLISSILFILTNIPYLNELLKEININHTIIFIFFNYVLLFLGLFDKLFKLFFIIEISLIPALIYFKIVHSDLENFKCIDYIDTALLFIPIILVIVILLLSVFCVKTVNEDTNKKLTTDEGEIENSGNIEFCKYCEERTDYIYEGRIPKIIGGKYLCSSCNSVLWYNLSGKPFVLQLSIFMLEQRWQVIAGISALLFFTPMALLVEKRSAVAETMKMETQENSKELNKILDDLSFVRAKIIHLEFPKGDEYDMNLLGAMHEAYTRIYWNIVPAFERLLENKLNENKEFRAIFESSEAKLSKMDIDSINRMNIIAKIIKNDSFDISGVKTFVEYLNIVYECENKTPNNDATCIEIRKCLANKVYHELRFTSIVIRSLIDSDWILNKEGEYKYTSEAVDDLFYIDNIFLDRNPLNFDSLELKLDARKWTFSITQDSCCSIMNNHTKLQKLFCIIRK